MIAFDQCAMYKKGTVLRRVGCWTHAFRQTFGNTKQKLVRKHWWQSTAAGGSSLPLCPNRRNHCFSPPQSGVQTRSTPNTAILPFDICVDIIVILVTFRSVFISNPSALILSLRTITVDNGNLLHISYVTPYSHPEPVCSFVLYKSRYTCVPLQVVFFTTVILAIFALQPQRPLHRMPSLQSSLSLCALCEPFPPYLRGIAYPSVTYAQQHPPLPCRLIMAQLTTRELSQ